MSTKGNSDEGYECNTSKGGGLQGKNTAPRDFLEITLVLADHEQPHEDGNYDDQHAPPT